MKMTYTEVIERIKAFTLEEVRIDSSEMFEFVIRNDYMNQLDLILARYFGLPSKPANKKPSRRAKKLTAPYGGIRWGQTLYCIKDDTVFNLALLWPWANGEFATVKIIQNHQPKLEPQSESFWRRIIDKIFLRTPKAII